MRCSLRFTLGVLGTSLLLAGCGSASSDGDAEARKSADEFTSEDVAAIRATSERWLNAVREKRWNDAAATYTRDAILWFGQERFEGRDAIRRSLEEQGPFPPSLELHLDEIEGRGDMAFVSGYATVTPEGGEPVKMARYLDVRLRQPDGTWLFYRDMVIPAAEPVGGQSP